MIFVVERKGGKMAEYIFEINDVLLDEETGKAVMKPKVNGELIRCKNCKWFYEDKWCVRYMYALLPEDFCSYAERREE